MLTCYQMSKRASQNSVSLMEKQVAERRRRVLVAARKFVIKHGVEGVNVRALALACRVSVPTIYRTFGSKEGLLSEAMQPYVEASVRADTGGEVAGKGHVRLLGLVTLWSQGFAGSGDDERAFMGGFLKSEAGQGLAWKVSQQIRAEAESALREMQACGELASWTDPASLAARIAAQTAVSAIECASGALTPRGYRSAFVYAACLIVLGVAEGAARDALRERAELAQESAAERTPLARVRAVRS